MILPIRYFSSGDSLFTRLGGAPAIDAAVDLFYKKNLADARVSAFFATTNMEKQRKKQKLFLSYAFGAPTKYDGLDMRNAHKKMNLTEMHFNAIAENLTSTLQELGVK